ncbi:MULTISPECIES: sensor histidine kinase [Nocardiopsis]|uniref:histidine kinase n=2 Tax=Nocardiopsis TaxID=2013 RepID=D7B6C3_NOCDD|nr:sensor histidine kinase [Nocardiopsis dassonvillei]ADH67388.1 integral membrane sensor signal transduction histidine kinase [Nocardiopsis dassonvillei subsp. dassonvillei DSM 43111]NKY77391.1 sensor histidine kinase [Nocardiopsis dassonvillei]VEI87532.1 Sensor histidine kinase desK [Nocardiopsis dassonvillei]
MATAPHHRAGRLTTLAYLFLLLSQNIAALLLLPLVLLSAVLTLTWVGLPFVILTALLLRTLADSQRRTLSHLLIKNSKPPRSRTATPGLPTPTTRPLHRPIVSAYRPIPPTGITRRGTAIITDPATWRDLLWLISGAASFLLVATPLTLIAHGIEQLLFALNLTGPTLYDTYTPTTTLNQLIILIPALALITLGWLLIPLAADTYLRFNRLLLSPSEKARLTARVAHLATSRAHTIDTQASEIRRIERDLHDGAQARLVALGMNLGMAEQIVDKDPETARAMLTEARETTRHALTELRDLVRGIHPPVLVERGLDGAVHALALTHHLPITVTIDLRGRPADPVESAAYFAIAELLTNTAKHAHATHAWIHINHGRNRLVITVTDNGTGGADPAPGSGLAGIRRRLDAFDGTMNITSPPGGPTIVTLEIPCVLSSPKTLPSSETA